MDLKPQNILVFDSGVLKVGDFGLCETIKGEDDEGNFKTGSRGTTNYLPPEQILNQ